jgi:hypothetical protein
VQLQGLRCGLVRRDVGSRRLSPESHRSIAWMQRARESSTGRLELCGCHVFMST